MINSTIQANQVNRNLIDDILASFSHNPVSVNRIWAGIYALLLLAVILQQSLLSNQAGISKVLVTIIFGAVQVTAILVRHIRPVLAFLGTVLAGVVIHLFGINGPESFAILITLWTLVQLGSWVQNLIVLSWPGVIIVQRLILDATNWSATLYPVIASMVVVMLVSVVVRQRRSISTTREKANQDAAEAATAAARLRIATDMHDIVGHGLTSVINLTDTAVIALEHDDDTEALRMLTRANQVARNALKESRGVIARLRDETAAPLEPQPTLSDLESLIETANQAGLLTSLEETGERPQGLLSTDAYRIIQEAITNILRHSSAKQLWITLEHSTEGTAITVKDDGQAICDYILGNGLIGMQQRAAAHGGVFTAGPTPTGWVVQARLESA